MEPPIDDGVEAVESRLRAERDRTAALIADLKNELVGIAESTAAGPDDEHDSEGSTVAYERARVQALLAHAERSAAALEAASQRLGSQSRAGAGQAAVTRCAQCDGAIPAERLIAVPATLLCVSCAASSR